MPEEAKPARPATGSTITVRVTVTDREEGSFTDNEVAVSEVTERVLQPPTGDRYGPVLPTIESVAREAVNKTHAQLVAAETLAKAREA